MPEDVSPPPPPYVAPSYPAPYVPPRRRSAWFYIGTIGGSFAVIALVLTGIIWGTTRSSGWSPFGSDEIAVIDVTGMILTADKIDAQLRAYADDDSVKAIILHIDSPGGAASPSQEIYHEIERLRQEKHTKIVASVDSVGASGAYYIASACDRVYANQASVVGSIGVVMEWTNYGDLMRWAKLKSVDIHAGELKTAGDPSRDMTPKEQAYFQSLVDNMYSQFVHDVAVGRHTTEDKIKPLATGQVWTGQQALPLGLIDKEGGLRVALMDTAKEVGISGEPTVVSPAKEERGLLSMLLSGGEDLFPNPGKLLEHAPGFYFLWK
ncbi:signal peptide peptidase SppA [Granulicella arctica]|uniref:Protease-4 n=1 Tax=Granulicella arctica TaxID=940613 RepID=A0A7Y9PGL7_9BACT|nr:signal peptide peptidase SppA [Granulicella arctica]NYF79538.1 protease-4 [Granulicella arctica]